MGLEGLTGRYFLWLIKLGLEGLVVRYFLLLIHAGLFLLFFQKIKIDRKQYSQYKKYNCKKIDESITEIFPG